MKKLITCLVVCVMSGAAFAETWTVDDDGKADFDNIQAAVDAAGSGDEILVYPGTYTSEASDVVLVQYKSVWLHSTHGPEVTIIDGQGTGIVVNLSLVSTGTKLEGFTITNGYIGIYCGGCSPLILDCTITNNNQHGIKISYQSGWARPEIRDCSILNNTTTTSNEDGAGIMINTSTEPIIIDCIIANNSSGTNGGGIYVKDSAIITRCTFRNNTANGRGGAVYGYADNGPLDASIGDCQFDSNTATSGGAIFCVQSIYIGNCVICENSSPQLMGAWIDVGENEITELCGLGACCTNNQANCVESHQSDCEFFGGIFQGYGFECGDVSCVTSCFGDITGDGQVNVSDLLAIIAVWGACP